MLILKQERDSYVWEKYKLGQKPDLSDHLTEGQWEHLPREITVHREIISCVWKRWQDLFQNSFPFFDLSWGMIVLLLTLLLKLNAQENRKHFWKQL